MNRIVRRGLPEGIVEALLAALLFGLSAPVGKKLLGDVAPQLLAGLLYLGSGIGLGAFWLMRRQHAECVFRGKPSTYSNRKHPLIPIEVIQ
jgi:drug/metabolite transporter (DMT)-like permease